MKLRANGFEKIGKAKITVEYDPIMEKWEAREKPTFWNLWFGGILCWADSREAAIERARVVLQEKARKETVEVEL